MVLLSTLISLLLSPTLVFANLLPADRTTRSPREAEPGMGRTALMRNQDRQQRSLSSEGNSECQEGNPPGVNYSGKVNVTASGRACKVWPAWMAIHMDDVGEHNYCRNPDWDRGGVWCFTTDEDVYLDYCYVPLCAKVIDFSADNDGERDSNGEWTSATLNAGNLPESFTICSAFMVDAWTTGFTGADIFTLLDDEGDQWVWITLYAAPSQTEYDVGVKWSSASFTTQTTAVFFPLQWTRVCLSLDFVSNTVTLVVNGQLLGEGVGYEADWRPTNLSLLLGSNCLPWGMSCNQINEYTGRVADINVFNSSLSLEKMVRLTTAGEEECGAAGDLVSWEEAEWTLHSQAKIIQVDKRLEDPCRKESTVQVFAANFKWNRDCMRHCQKIAGGRAPPVTTGDELLSLFREVHLLSQDRSILARMWLSATEGDKGNKLARLDHWKETEIVEAVETVWRDFYTGQRLENWTNWNVLDWESYMRGTNATLRMLGHDTLYGETYNCMVGEGWKSEWERIDRDTNWYESQCDHDTSYASCPCTYPAQPLLRLRGLCSASLIDLLFSPKQLPDNPGNMIMVGKRTTRIEFNETSSHWTLTDAKLHMTAVSKASKLSYALGKHNWTISNDDFACNEGKPYTCMLKLTGCKEEGEFTCNDGQCIEMERRCDQVTGKEPNCRDESDEDGCQLIVFKNNYNKNIPPIGLARDGSPIPASVSISINLLKVVEIEETDHSIHLQFEINLQWKENRVKYQHLKDKTSLNALADDDISKLWLPLVIYSNTDQKESTRLGVEWEWVTRVSVIKEGKFTRTGFDEIDEDEIFEGAENSLTMTQTYTWEFQCLYKLQQYPFDTQVNNFQCSINISDNCLNFRNVPSR